MRILTIEDEASIQDRIVRLTTGLLGDSLKVLDAVDCIDQGLEYLKEKPIDLLLLDLNLNGSDGFDLLRELTTHSFHTVVISAYPERAIEAYELGVIDFITKPFDEERLKVAFERIQGRTTQREHFAKFLTIRKLGMIELIELDEVSYIQADGGYSQLHLKNGKTEMHDKMMKDLCQLLPAHFERVHKSYVVNLNEIKGIQSKGGHKNYAVTKNDMEIPLSRSKYKELKSYLKI